MGKLLKMEVMMNWSLNVVLTPECGRFRQAKISEILYILKNNNVLLVLIILTITTEIFGFSHNSIMPILVKDVLRGDADDLGFMMILRQLGGIIGILLIIAFGNTQKKGLWLLYSAVIQQSSILTTFFIHYYNKSNILISVN